ncbi:hydrophobin-263 [Pluteus cervinus]|uniref:Hydrophobin-263 n=1 Tax=Pluteus cervinus TaxID=181527 RepID=A0ACD3A8J7_9AGAR|nr:hydrophobin-263 [Pluteus cervinus]
MFSSISAISLLALLLLATASVLPRQSEHCDVGLSLCCRRIQESTTADLALLSRLLGIDIPDLGGSIGVSCDPLSILGLNGNDCFAQPACCIGSTLNGLIHLGCTRINLNL